MRACKLLCVLAGMSFLVEGGSPRDDAEKAKPERVAALIEELGDDAFAKREAASKALETVGRPALRALLVAVTTTDNPETRRRAERLIRAIAGPMSRVKLKSPISSPGLPLAESKHLVYAVEIDAHVDAKGEGLGKLILIRPT